MIFVVFDDLIIFIITLEILILFGYINRLYWARLLVEIPYRSSISIIRNHDT